MDGCGDLALTAGEELAFQDALAYLDHRFGGLAHMLLQGQV